MSMSIILPMVNSSCVMEAIIFFLWTLEKIPSHLSPSQYFQTYDGDRVGACMRKNEFEFLDILAQDASESFRVARWGRGLGHCGENDMR